MAWRILYCTRFVIIFHIRRRGGMGSAALWVAFWQASDEISIYPRAGTILYYYIIISVCGARARSRYPRPLIGRRQVSECGRWVCDILAPRGYRNTVTAAAAAAESRERAGGRCVAVVVGRSGGKVWWSGARQRGVRGEVRRRPPATGFSGKTRLMIVARPSDRPTHLHNWSGFLRSFVDRRIDQILHRRDHIIILIILYKQTRRPT